MSDYGHFSEDGLEYIVTRPDPPRPWANYLSNGTYCALITHTGGGYSFIGGAGFDRITRAIPGDMVIADRPGRYIFLRDEDTGDYWSANWQPMRKEPDRFEARHGLGRTTVSSSNHGISSSITYFVPLDKSHEIWTVRLRNDTDHPRKLAAWSYVEWSLASYAGDLLERSFFNLFNETSVSEGVIFATKRFWSLVTIMDSNRTWDKYAFMTSNGPVTGYDCDKEAFVGTFHSLEDPLVVLNGKCANTSGTGFDSVGVLQHELTLDPGEERRFDIVVGAVRQQEEAQNIKERYSSPERVDEELERLDSCWKDYLSQLWVETPDQDMNLSVNVWNKYQAWVTFHWSRMASLYIGGGSIMGFRDTSQDILGMLPMNLALAKVKTKEIIRHQFADGGTIHNWDPLTNTGPRTGHSDDPLWLVMCILNYVKESQDLNFLKESVPYFDKGDDSIYNHLVRALDYSLEHRSARGLSLMGAADWNDGLDMVGRQGRGESVMTTEFLCWMLYEVAELMHKLGNLEQEEHYQEMHEEVVDALNHYAWDGKWYIRGTLDNGQVFGSSKNEEGKIYLNAQSWAVLGDAATDNRAIECMDSVRRELDTEYGPVLFRPAYRKPDPAIGIITRFAPGTKENATIFNHSVTWAIIAECMLGRADRAYHYWKETSFLTRGKEPDIYKVEPYVYCEYIYGPDHPRFGQGEFSWTTGTATWMWRACIDWILGVRVTLDGLLVDPCIPADWNRYVVKRKFYGASYEILVENPDRVSTGVSEVWVDGRKIEGTILPTFRDGGAHQVKVVMGRAGAGVPTGAIRGTAANRQRGSS